MASRRFAINLPIPMIGDVVVFHARDADGSTVDFPAVVFAVVCAPSAEYPDPGVVDLRVLAIDGDAFIPGARWGRGRVGCWSRPARPENFRGVVEVPEGEDLPDLDEAPDWYRKMTGRPPLADLG